MPLYLSVKSKNADVGVATATGLTGYSFCLQAHVTGELNSSGMLVDLKQLKSLLNECIDLVDHRMIVPEALGSGVGRVRGSNFELYTPLIDAFFVLTCEDFSLDSMLFSLKTLFFNRVSAGLPAQVKLECVGYDQPDSVLNPPGYIHVLPQYAGLCRRPHGHTCEVHVRSQDGHTVAKVYELEIASQLKDRVVCNRREVAKRNSKLLRIENSSMTLEIPTETAVILDGPSTIENLATHFSRPGCEVSLGEGFGGRAEFRNFTLDSQPSIG